jgi:hypothetical protein
MVKNKEHHGHRPQSQIQRIDILDIPYRLLQNSETIEKEVRCLKIKMFFHWILAGHSHINIQTQTEILKTQKKGLDVLHRTNRTVVRIPDHLQENDHVLQS